MLVHQLRIAEKGTIAGASLADLIFELLVCRCFDFRTVLIEGLGEFACDL